MAMTKIPLQIGGFEILGTLGRGGMGVVYAARDNTLQRDLAIKVQTGDWKLHPELLQRFLREARILASINHPNVVNIFSVGEHEGAPFFVMELLDGSIADAARLKMPGMVQLKRWMLEAAKGLAAIHEMGVVHRDIKPGNLLLTRATSVEEEHVKVADLGIASAGDQFGGQLTRVGAIMGTSGYLAPEAFRRDHTLDSRADQYSLGVVFFELLARRGPYQDPSDRALPTATLQPRTSPDVREFRPEVDAATAQLISRMLMEEPDQRFDSSAALVQALTRVQGNPPTSAVNVDPPSPAPAVAAASPPPALVTRQLVPQATSGGGWLKAVVAAVLLLMFGFAALDWANPGLLRGATDATVAASPANVADPVAPAQAAPAIDALHREAWAKYVLGYYQLKSWADGEGAWTLDLLKQKDGVVSGKLKGPEPATIELTGRVDSQSEQSMDGQDWDVYQLSMTGADGRTLELRIEFSETETGGQGLYEHAGLRQRFDVVDSEDL